MAKVSAITRSGNAGEISPLMEGRTDWDRYAASMRVMENFVAAQQGPIIRRSGTIFTAKAFAAATKSHLRPFIFNNEQANCVEFAHNRIRFVDEQGVLTETPVNVLSVVTESPFVIEAPGLAATVGDQVALAGWPAALNVNGQIVTCTAVAGDNYTLDFVYSNPGAIAIGTPTAAKVYHVTSTYAGDDVQNIRVLQDRDTLYLFCDGYRVRTLQRQAATTWVLEDVNFIDGPYEDEDDSGVNYTLSGTGNAAIHGTTGTAASAGSATGKGPELAFNQSLDNYWESDTDQTGILSFNPDTDFACTGYSIHLATDNSNTSFTNRDYAPGEWDFEGYDGSAWVVLDTQIDYELYDGDRSVYFELNNDVVYDQYRIRVKKVTRNGNIPPRIAQLTLTSADSTSITLTASDTDGVNSGQGYLSTDVGRLVRMRGRDGMWRPLRITAVNSTTEIVATLESAPFPTTDDVSRWRIGSWSDTTGWPTCAAFFDDRMVMGGAEGSPNQVVGSVPGAFINLTASEAQGEVLDDNAFNIRLRSRQLVRTRWIESDSRGILLGTGSAEFIITSPDAQKGIGPLNIRVRRTSRRGSADVDPVAVDTQVLYVQKARRQVREMAYVFENDGYNTPSMSIYASHIGSDRLAQVEYAAEPHSIAWYRQDSGKVAGFTYNREEGVLGWHRHDVGGVVESICVIPANDERQDILWMVVKRTINGQDERYIERLAPFWDFDDTLASAHFVDSGLSATFGSPANEINGLSHLEGEEVYGLADDIPFDKLTVTNGAIELPENQECSKITVGLPYTSLGETSRIDAGASDGTSVGKLRRINNVSFLVWDTAGGEYAVWDEEQDELAFQDIEYDEAPFDEIETAVLRTTTVGPLTPSPGYEKRGSVGFRQTEPLPMNIVATMPQLHVQDR